MPRVLLVASHQKCSQKGWIVGLHAGLEGWTGGNSALLARLAEFHRRGPEVPIVLLVASHQECSQKGCIMGLHAGLEDWWTGGNSLLPSWLGFAEGGLLAQN